MAPDFETGGDKVEKDLCDVSPPEICNISVGDLNCQSQGHIDNHIDKGDLNGDLHPRLNGKVEEDDDNNDGIPAPEVQIYPPNQVCLEWAKIHKVGAGLANLGNTCFLNTVIQCLTYCPPLANYLLQGDHSANCKTFQFCMMCELQKHMRQVFQRSGDVIKPLCIYQNLKYIADHFQFGQQEDAHEFLRFVIDNLWRSSICSHPSDDNLDPASRETTIINHIFGGYNRSQVVCLQCKLKSDKYEHFMDFILDIQNSHTLEKAVEQFVKPELLEKDNAYKCPKCDALVPAEKTFTIHRPPNVATFQLKRFDYNKSYGKITKHVSYPENFDLRPYMSLKKGGTLLYKLNAVLVHVGQNCNSGHYYCYIRNSNGYWYLMDDAKVQKVSLHDVLNQQAYVLFYVRSSGNGMHFKKNGVTSFMDIQNIRIRSSDEELVELSNGNKKNQSPQKTSDYPPKMVVNGGCSVLRSSSVSSPRAYTNGTAQSYSRQNVNSSDHVKYDADDDDDVNAAKYSRAFKPNNKSSYSSTRYSLYKRGKGKTPNRHPDFHQKNGSSGEGGGYHTPRSNGSRPSSALDRNNFDNDRPQENGASVGGYNGHNNYRPRSSSVERHNYRNSHVKQKPCAKNVSHPNSFGQEYYPASNANHMYRGDQYSCKNNNYYASNQERSYSSSSNRSGANHHNGNGYPNHQEMIFHNANYSNGNSREYQHDSNFVSHHANGYGPPSQCDSSKDYADKQFPFLHHRNEHSSNKVYRGTFFKDREQKFSEYLQNRSNYFHERPNRNADFKNRFSQKGYDNDRIWRKENSTSLNNSTRNYHQRNYQGKMKSCGRYFSCGMADFSSAPSFGKLRNMHRSYPYHKCF